MVEPAQVSKTLKEAMKSGKYSLGAREVLTSIKGSKAIIFTKSVPLVIAVRLREAAQKQGVPVIDLNATSAELARMIGRPYKVSAMALRSLSEADLKQLLR
jgi:large subunit ribosomal protein L30e